MENDNVLNTNLAPSEEAEDYAQEKHLDYQLYLAFKLLNFGYSPLVVASILDMKYHHVVFVDNNRAFLNDLMNKLEATFGLYHPDCYHIVLIVGIRFLARARKSADTAMIVKLIGYTDIIDQAKEWRSLNAEYVS